MGIYCSIAELGLYTKPDWSREEWGRVNDRFVNQVLSLAEIADHLASGSSLSGVHDGRRKRENWKLIQHIAVDLDTEDERSSVLTLRQHPIVLAYGFMVYPTLNSRPDKPRSRVLFALEEPIRDFEGAKLAIAAITDFFSGADRACVDPCRQVFGNGKIARDDLWDDVWYEEKLLPLADLRSFARRLLERERAQERAVEQHKPDDVLALRELFDRLESIPPWPHSYDERLKLAAAVAHVYGDAAFMPLKKWWDARGESRMTWQKWQGLRGTHPNPAGYGTIV